MTLLSSAMSPLSPIYTTTSLTGPMAQFVEGWEREDQEFMLNVLNVSLLFLSPRLDAWPPVIAPTPMFLMLLNGIFLIYRPVTLNPISNLSLILYVTLK